MTKLSLYEENELWRRWLCEIQNDISNNLSWIKILPTWKFTIWKSISLFLMICWDFCVALHSIITTLLTILDSLWTSSAFFTIKWLRCVCQRLICCTKLTINDFGWLLWSEGITRMKSTFFLNHKATLHLINFCWIWAMFVFLNAKNTYNYEIK